MRNEETPSSHSSLFTPHSSLFPVTVYTLGCKLNQLESEAIADSFKKAGFSLVPWGAAIDGPGLIIINTCTVTSKADQKSRRVIRQALRENPLACVIVTGCYAQLEAEKITALEDESGEPGLRRLFVVGGANSSVGDASSAGNAGAGAAKSPLLDLPGYLQEAGLETESKHGNKLPQILRSWSDIVKGASPFNFIPEEFAFHSRGYLKIQDGCDNSCTFCRTRLARGPSVSMPAKAVLDQLRSLEAKGCAELMITGVNITQYQDTDFDLSGLLEYLLEGSSTIALRLASLEPEGVTEKLVSVLAHPRIRPHFHLSVQSGSNTILQKMCRAYASQAAENAAALLRSAKDNPFLACDIIAGFPGETEADFADTVTLCKKIRFAWIHAFPYSRRPGTQAFHFDNPVCERDTTHRVELLTGLARQGRQDYARQWLGRELSAIVQKGPHRAGRFRAVSENYLKLLINCPGNPPPPGSSLRCIPAASGMEGADLIANLV